MILSGRSLPYWNRWDTLLDKLRYVVAIIVHYVQERMTAIQLIGPDVLVALLIATALSKTWRGARVKGSV